MPLSVKELQLDLGVKADGQFGPISRAALRKRFTCANPVMLSTADMQALATRWNVPVTHIKGVRKVEAPRGAFDTLDRPSILYERHVFSRNTVPPGRFDGTHGALSGPGFKPGQYGSFTGQWDKLGDACALDPNAAFEACSFGAFQVLGENAEALGYASAYAMAKTMITSEAAHLEAFARYVEHFGLLTAFRQCRAGDPASCVPFVRGYNGPGWRTWRYDEKLASAIRP